MSPIFIVIIAVFIRNSWALNHRLIYCSTFVFFSLSHYQAGGRAGAEPSTFVWFVLPRQFGQLGLGFVFTSPIKARVYVICALFGRLCLEIKVKLCPRRGNDIFSCDAKPPRRPSLDHLRPVTAAVTSLQLSHSLSVLRCSLLILTQSAKTQTDLESWTIVFSFKWRQTSACLVWHGRRSISRADW